MIAADNLGAAMGIAIHLRATAPLASRGVAAFPADLMEKYSVILLMLKLINLSTIVRSVVFEYCSSLPNETCAVG